MSQHMILQGQIKVKAKPHHPKHKYQTWWGFASIEKTVCITQYFISQADQVAAQTPHKYCNHRHKILYAYDCNTTSNNKYDSIRFNFSDFPFLYLASGWMKITRGRRFIFK